MRMISTSGRSRVTTKPRCVADDPRMTTSRIIHLALWLLLAAQGATAQVRPPWTTPAVASPLVEYRLLDSAIAGTAVSYHVYLPRAYHQEQWRRFPVIYWLHGSGTPIDGVAIVAARFDQAISAGRIPPVIVVFPNGLPYGHCLNFCV